ncbi:lysoplasmalogenase [Dyadobacter sp. CY312]|uniref:lysoplasmalogenase n=1 Tax=Dyadobacter sp. CY312 TaxID=2907303 RepID=UPI001F189261|nr:lysoplasmalogenase [Dyadobacter sp. CY312]MCE7039520.1 lysoplasmalogenase [Dyadobacter sp. CY312]
MKSKHLFTILYILIAVTEISADLAGLVWLVYIFKPLIILSLLVFVLKRQRISSTKKPVLFLAALVFALLGDILLMIQGVDLFIPGLGSFLMMQLLYIVLFRSDISSSIYVRTNIKSALLFLVFALGLYVILFPYLPDPVMRTAVAIYALSIASMAWMAWLRKSFVSRTSFKMVFAGALFFMLSDSLIAIDRFLISVPFNTIWVMSTYAAAQYLIIMGILKTKRTGSLNQPADT